MSKITIPTIAVKTTGNLFEFYFNNAILRSDINKSELGEDSIAEGVFNFNISDILNILLEGGNIEGYLMAIRAPKSGLQVAVPDGLPNNKKFDGSAKTIENWFNTGAEVIENADKTEIVFWTNPFSGNENIYLKGSEIKILNDLSNVTVITIAEAQELKLNGWTNL